MSELWAHPADLRPELDPLPERIAALPRHRGYPVPWFVAWPDGPGGAPEFRAADAPKRALAVRAGLCWVCGEKLGKFRVFVVGPMCVINRVTAEPPCHRECALWSVRNCPFLSKPQMVRRENDLPEDRSHDGLMILRNPGVMVLWTVKALPGRPGFSVVRDGLMGVGGTDGGWLLRLGEPAGVECWRERRPATRAEVLAAVDAGLPALEQQAALFDRQQGGTLAMDDLRAGQAAAARYWPEQ